MMKAIILAGGTGSRLYPLTHTGPKQLLPVANKPVLEYAIEDCAEAGIDEIAIVLGTKGRQEIQEHVADGSQWGVDVTYIVQGEPLGLAHAIACGRDFVGRDPFVVYLGDIMIERGITGLVEGFEESTEVARMGVQEVAEPSRYGILQVADDGQVEEIVEKPDDPQSNLAAVGIGAFSPLIFEEIDELTPSNRGELELSDASQRLIERGKNVRSYVFDGWWKDAGTPEDVLEVNRLVLQNQTTDHRGVVEIGEGTVIEEGATIHGPVSVGSGTTIGSDVEVGPYVSIGDNCEIRRTSLESSIVQRDSTITTSEDIEQSLIGKHVTIEQRTTRGTALVVADNTTIEI